MVFLFKKIYTSSCKLCFELFLTTWNWSSPWSLLIHWNFEGVCIMTFLKLDAWKCNTIVNDMNVIVPEHQSVQLPFFDMAYIFEIVNVIYFFVSGFYRYQIPFMKGAQFQKFLSMMAFPYSLGSEDTFYHLCEKIVTNPYMNGEVVKLDGAVNTSFFWHFNILSTYMWLVNYSSTVCTNSLNVWARKVHILTARCAVSLQYLNQ